MEKENMTVVNCEITSCKYNSSCCSCSTEDKTICLKKGIAIIITEDGYLDCESFEEDDQKETECYKCQLKRNGAINIHEEKLNIKDIGNIKF